LRSVTAAGGLLLAVPNLTSAQQQNFAWDNYYTVGSLDFCASVELHEDRLLRTGSEAPARAPRSSSEVLPATPV